LFVFFTSNLAPGTPVNEKTDEERTEIKTQNEILWLTTGTRVSINRRYGKAEEAGSGSIAAE
jgi:hypothetical protein